MLTTLRQIIEQVLKEPQIDVALNYLVKKTREALNVDCCSVYLAEEERQRYRLIATDGLSKESVGKVVLRFGEGLVGLVGKTNELLNLADAKSHANFKYIPEVGEEEFQSFLGVPIEKDGAVLGVLVIQQKESRQFNEMEESFLVTLAAQLASILYLSELKEKEENDNHQVPLKCAFGSGGIAIARGWVWQPHMELEQVLLNKTDDPEMQVELFHQAVFQLQLDLDSLSLRIYDSVEKKDLSNVFDEYQQLLDDGEFTCTVDQKIYDAHWSASSALKLVTEEIIAEKEKHGLKEEALNIKDLAQRILSRLAHSYLEEFDFKEPVILLAEEITAALIAEVPRERIAGIVSLQGSGNSIAAILARNLNIPTLIGVDIPLQKLDRHLFIVDGIRKELLVDPTAGVLTEYQGMILDNEKNSKILLEEQFLPADTEDGVHINVNLNAGLSFDEKEQSILPLIDGVGLYRTEIEFMMHKNFPTELEECRHYEEVLKNFAEKKVVMRTMDVGGDKPLPYLPMNELNPFLGWRGIRVSLDKPNLLLAQFRAMLKANRKYENLSIMLPMISSLDEVLAAKKLLDQAYNEICEEYSTVIDYPKIGAMIEVPAVLFILEDLAPHVDFFSIGSNDLTQYTLAVDRNNPKVSKLYDSFQPSMLRAFYRIFRICDKEIHRPISVCGEVAGDPLGALMLISIGYRELSMNYTSVPLVKYILRHVNMSELQEVFAKAIKLQDAIEIRNLYRDYANKKGLLSMIK